MATLRLGSIATPVVEEYLQNIHFMIRDGVPVIAARLAERLRVRPPTVTATLQRMERDGLVEHGPYREIRFTELGRQTAEDLVRRHALAERLLTDFLKMPWHEAHEESHGIEHAITPKVEARLLEALGNPTTCPHGNPIPRLGKLAADEFPLDRAAEGETIALQRITEEAEVARSEQRLVLEGDRGRAELDLAAAGKLRAVRASGL